MRVLSFAHVLVQSQKRLLRQPFRSILRCERVEDRVVPAATLADMANALDLPQGVAVNSSEGDPVAFHYNTRPVTNRLLGFPSGKDDDFLVISTGKAADVDTLSNTSGSQGTDLGSSGAGGDTARLNYSVSVPASSVPQSYLIDFIFMSEEFPEFVGSQFNDFLTITVNGTNIALDQNGNQVNVNNAFFQNSSVPGTFFDGSTIALSARYNVKPGETALNVEIAIGDVGDGIYDSAALLDNARFEAGQLVYLDFDGHNFGSFFFPQTSVTMPAFTAADVKGAAGTEAQIISQLVSKVQGYYSGLNITFTTSQPTSGDYMHVVIGGDNDVTLSVSHPGLTPKVGNSATYRQVYKAMYNKDLGTLFGKASAVDLGNLVRNDRAVVFSGVYDNFFSSEDSATIITRMATTIAHEVGHNLGTRHLTNASTNSILKKNGPRDLDSTFRNELIALGEIKKEDGTFFWYDKAELENTYSYLLSVLGSTTGTGSLSKAINQNDLQDFFTLDLSGLTLKNVFDLEIGFLPASSDSDGDAADTSPVMLPLPTTNTGLAQFSLPKGETNPTVFLQGSTSPGGPKNVFSGTPTNGNLEFQQMTLNLKNADGSPKALIPMATGTPGNFTSAGFAGLNTVGGTPQNPPTVVLNQAPDQADPAASDTVKFQVVFNKPVQGLDATDIILGGTAPGNKQISVAESGPLNGTTYTVTVSGITGPGTVTASVKAGAATDSLGVANPAGSTSTDNQITIIPKVLKPGKLFAVGGGIGSGGIVRMFNQDGTEKFALTAFPGFTGGVRTATGDFNGDGVEDLAVGMGPGALAQVVVFDGKTQAELFRITPFQDFTGGVFVAAGDLNGDKQAELIITPDQGGGPRVRIFSGGSFNQLADFLGINDPAFRGGARPATGDLNGDGKADLLVGAGFGGGPRAAIFDGFKVASEGNSPDQGPEKWETWKLTGDFFAFEPTLRDGMYLAAADIDADGKGDLVFGAGPGGGPRVRIASGSKLLATVVPSLDDQKAVDAGVQIANFFGGDVNNRGGIRVITKDLDNDDLADLVLGAGDLAGSRVTTYAGKTIPAQGTPPELSSFDAFANFTNGVFVG